MIIMLRTPAARLHRLLVAALFVLAPVAASAQSDLADQIDRLRRDVTLLQQRVYAQGGAGATQPGPGLSAGAAANLDVRVSQLEQDLRNTTGQIEQVQYELGQVKQRLDRLASDLDFRLAQLEKGAGHGAAPAAAGNDAPSPGEPRAVPGSGADLGNRQGPGAPPRDLGTVAERDVPKSLDDARATQIAAATPKPSDLTPKQQYDGAIKLLVAGQFAEAEGALKAFVQANPKDALVPNAQYWLGESYYARQQYDDAAKAFLSGYQKYPQAPKAPDSLLKLGLSLAALNKKPEACAAYGRLIKEFPKAASNLRQRAGEERKKLACA